MYWHEALDADWSNASWSSYEQSWFPNKEHL